MVVALTIDHFSVNFRDHNRYRVYISDAEMIIFFFVIHRNILLLRWYNIRSLILLSFLFGRFIKISYFYLFVGRNGAQNSLRTIRSACDLWFKFYNRCIIFKHRLIFSVNKISSSPITQIFLFTHRELKFRPEFIVDVFEIRCNLEVILSGVRIT